MTQANQPPAIPGRFIDSVAGDFWVADVGQETWEEVNRLPAGTAPGANLGWVYWEGNHATALNPDPTDTAGYTFPIHTFPHGQGENNSVSGGFVYRGTSEAMQEHYVFVDFSQGRIYTLEETGGAPIVTERTGDVAYDSDRTISTRSTSSGTPRATSSSSTSTAGCSG